MSARAYTDEQQEAIRRREGPLLLAAAAGSGKTSVLVERFVRMVVDDQIAPGRILAITFTEKAAGELRSRIRAELLARGERALAQDAEAAWISTFHGFCARVLRAHAVAAGLDPRFVVLDEAAGRQLREAAFEQALRSCSAARRSRPDRRARPGRRLDGRPPEGRDPQRPCPAAQRAGSRARGSRAGPDAGAGAPEPRPHGAATRRWRRSRGSRASVAEARLALERCGELLDGPPAAAAPAPSRRRRSRPATPGRSRPSRAPATAGAETYAQVWTEAAGARGRADRRAARALRRRLRGGQGARSALDFDDLELLVADLFDPRPGLAAAWAARFERVMVDEFQDTNPASSSCSSRLDSGHMFRVGDEFQSIYGFRHAASRSSARRRVPARGPWPGDPELPQRRVILDVVNVAFAPLYDGPSCRSTRPRGRRGGRAASSSCC